MYEDHYGLSGRPFQLTPDPRFWYETATHRKAMAYLGYGLAQGEGFIVISGEIGAGKTTLVGHLVETVDRAALHLVRIVSTQIEAEDLLRTVAEGLGIEAAGFVKADLLLAIERAIHAQARGGRRTLLIIDEAQALPLGSLEELRMLSNFQAGGHALLQIFLLGQPEFRDRLADPRLEQLRQRVIATHHLGPMEAEEVEAYLAHRLGLVGWTGQPGFAPEAIAAMHRWSGGIPRKLNQLASRLLLYGAIEKVERFTARDVADVIADFEGDVPAPQAAPVVEPRPIIAEAPIPIVAHPHPARASRLPPAPDGRGKGPAAEGSGKGEGDALPAPTDLALTRRVAELEKGLEEQDAALRRVLTLLVDWVEVGGDRPDLSSLRG
jgi:putative secretion ATPase (PEP-CTERM system associated)